MHHNWLRKGGWGRAIVNDKEMKAGRTAEKLKLRIRRIVVANIRRVDWYCWLIDIDQDSLTQGRQIGRTETAPPEHCNS